MTNEHEELRRLREEFVHPFYMSLLHGNLTGHNAGHSAEFCARIGDAARAVSDAQLFRLLREPEWRGRLTAAWFVGLTRRSSFIEEIGKLLLESKLVYAGQGYCVALGLIGGQACRSHLGDYLKEYLPLNGRFYDQTWAIGALAHLQGFPPQEFLEPRLWTEATGQLDPRAGIDDFADLVGHLQKNRIITC